MKRGLQLAVAHSEPCWPPPCCMDSQATSRAPVQQPGQLTHPEPSAGGPAGLPSRTCKRGLRPGGLGLAVRPAMQILDPRALDAAAEPLLSAPRSTAANAAALSGGARLSGDGQSGAASKTKPPQPGDLQFLRRFRALMALLRPWPALLLSLLSIAEALVVAQGALRRPAPLQCHPSVPPLRPHPLRIGLLHRRRRAHRTAARHRCVCTLIGRSGQGGGRLLQNRAGRPAGALCGCHGARRRAVRRISRHLRRLLLRHG